MVVAQVIEPSSKFALARGLRAETGRARSARYSLTGADEDDLDAAMDWLGPRQGTIEDALAVRHFKDGTLVLYDVSSAAFEGRRCRSDP